MRHSTAVPRQRPWKGVLTLAVAGVASLAFAASAGAAVIPVAPDNSSGTDNLAAAITTANTNSDTSNTLVLTLPAGATTGRWVPQRALPAITKNLTITGNHAVQAVNGTPAVIIDGSVQATNDPSHDEITINPGVSLTIEGVDLDSGGTLGGGVVIRDNGNLTTWSTGFEGAGAQTVVVATGATATLNESSSDSSSATNAINSSGTLTLNNSDITNNAAGGIGQSGGTVTLNNTLLANNNINGLGTKDCTGRAATQPQDNSMDDDGSCHVTYSNNQYWISGGGSAAGFPPPNTNGGPTDTVGTDPAAPTVSAGDPAKCPTTDQRFFAIPAGTTCDVGSYDTHGVQDTTPPSCTVTALIAGPPKQQQVTVTDSGSGMGPQAGPAGDPNADSTTSPQNPRSVANPNNPADAIDGLGITNGTVSFTPFAAPSRSGLVLTATKTNQTQLTSWWFTATDWAGNVRFCQ